MLLLNKILAIKNISLIRSLALLAFMLLTACANPAKNNIKKIDNEDVYKASHQLAQAASRHGDYQQAVNIYEKQLKDNPGDLNLHRKLAQAYFNNEQIEKALWWARKNANKEEDLSNLLLLGRCLLADERTEEALMVLKKAKAIAPKAPDPTDQVSLQLALSLGTALDASGNHNQAQKIYYEAKEFFPVNQKISNNLALSYLLEGSYKKSVDLLEKIYLSGHASEKVKQNLILALALSGEKEKALIVKSQILTQTQKKQNISLVGKAVGVRK